MITAEQWPALLRFDQLTAQIQNHIAFEEFMEPVIAFKPTYKFDKGTSIYDTRYVQLFTAFQMQSLILILGLILTVTSSEYQHIRIVSCGSREDLALVMKFRV